MGDGRARAGGPDAAALVGRDSSLARLADAIEAGQSCLVRGEAGIGKTALIRAAIARADRSFVVGRGLEMLRDVPYLALRQAVPDLPAAGEPATMVTHLRRTQADAFLVIDDLHWCDPDTLAVLEELCVLMPVLAGTRPDAGLAAAVVNRLTDVGTVVDLEPLDDPAARLVVQSLHPGALAPDVDRWLAGARGNPLMLELAATFGSGISDARPGAVVTAVVGSLAPPVLDATARLALAATPFHVPDVVRDELLVRRLADSLPDGRIELRHDLVADAAVALVGADRRRDLHRELASETPDPARRAFHLDAADDAVAAAGAARIAAAEAPTGWSRAGLLLVAARGTPAAEDPTLRIDAAEQLSLCGRYRDVIAVLEDTELADRALELRAGVALARAYWAETEIEDARAVIDRMLTLAADQISAEAVELLSLQSRIVARLDWDLIAAVEIGRAAVAMAHQCGAALVAAHSALGLALLMANDPEWQEQLEQAGALARAEDDLHNAVVTYDTLLFGHLLSGDPARCRAIAEEMVRATEGPSPAWNGYFRAAALMAGLHVGGDYAAVLAQGPPLLEGRLTHRTREMLTAVVTIARADTGDDEGALALGQQGLDASSDAASRSMALWALAETHWLAGRTGAIATADEALALEVGGYPGRVQAVLVGQWARHDHDEPIDPRSIEVMAAAFPNLRGAIDEVEGLSSEDPAVACVAFEAATGHWAPASRRAALRSRWAAGDAAMRAGDRERALAHLEAVDTECAALGLVPLGRRVQRSLRALGRRPTRAPSPQPVSAAQLEVLQRVARGQTTQEIARGLALEPSTIESHVRAAMRATGALTRLQAAAAILCAEPVDTGDRPNLVARTQDALDAHLVAARSRGITTVGLDEVPAAPWALDELPQIVTGAVRTTDDAAHALFAAARGAQVALILPDDLRAGAFLLDGLARVGPVRMLGAPAPVDELLDPLERQILDLLAGGRTITEIAKTVGYSRRTIQRRLVETRKRLGVATNVEALIVAGARTGTWEP